MGDPVGIGPEIVCKALADSRLRDRARFRVHGSEHAMSQAAARARVPPFWALVRDGQPSVTGGVLLIDDGGFAYAGGAGAAPCPTREGGAASFLWVEAAIRDAQRAPGDTARADAIVTAPISKTAWSMAGHTRWPGHTELLAERFHAPKSGMLFVGPHLRVMLASIHVPLMEVGRVLTTQRVLEAIELAHRACIELTANRRARIAVCGLNPHAGEGGLLGGEDERVIAPAIAAARAQGIDAHGPLPADTLFKAAAAPPFGKGEYDCIVAMYHDQGLIPVKLIDGAKAVNVTVGLPTIRTSPAHGTAYDIAGRNAADSESMRCAIELAIEMVDRARVGAPGARSTLRS